MDDGLAAALEGLVRGSPVPLRLTVEDQPPDRTDETVETTTYVVVAEAREGGRTRVEVVDDGVGGVDPDGRLQGCATGSARSVASSGWTVRWAGAPP